MIVLKFPPDFEPRSHQDSKTLEVHFVKSSCLRDFVVPFTRHIIEPQKLYLYLPAVKQN